MTTDMDMLGELLAECDGLVQNLRADLPKLAELEPDPAVLERMHRWAHTAKGLTGFLGLPGVTDAAARLAEKLRKLRDGELDPTSQGLFELNAILGSLVDMLSGLKGGAKSQSRITHAPLPAVFSKAAPAGEKALAPLVGELSRSVSNVLTSFGARWVQCGEVAERQMSVTTAELTVALHFETAEGLAAGAVFEFEEKGARALAEVITLSMVGEGIDGSPEEERELIEGALGEMTNRIVSEVLASVGSSLQASPRFFRGAGVGICALPQALFSFGADSDLAAFEVGILAGAVLTDEAATDTKPIETLEQERRVLIADDSVVMRKMLRRTLEGARFEVVAEAKNGRDAVDLFRAERPDLVVLDLNMPVMTGLDALKIIRADDPEARVLICSAVAESSMVRRGFKAGAVGYVTKPFDPPKLVATIESLFEEREPSQPKELSPLGVSTLGSYRVGDILGDGGMADVYKGYDPSLGREVALKVIKDELAHNVDFVVKFLNEARAVASVNHPNVVSIYFAGSDRGKHFFAMEFLPGPDLHYLVAREGVLLEHAALEFILQAARGLAAAKDRGLVHCDVKPSNLVLGADGFVKVTDFGIARPASAQEDLRSEVLGTPAYMSPEQVMGSPLDHRSDIYALGATLYFLLSGAPPYEGENDIEIALRQVHDPVPRLENASRKVNKLLGRMMAKSADSRHATYEELIAEINRLT